MMKMMKSEKRLCVCCMEEHEVKTVLVQEHASFKNEQISYEAMYLYCDQAEELYADEEMLKNNDIALKDAYRKKHGLLTVKYIIFYGFNRHMNASIANHASTGHTTPNCHLLVYIGNFI